MLSILLFAITTYLGVNIYWLGADENNPDVPFSGKLPTGKQNSYV
jgi:hypothetical protein